MKRPKYHILHAFYSPEVPDGNLIGSELSFPHTWLNNQDLLTMTSLRPQNVTVRLLFSSNGLWKVLTCNLLLEYFTFYYSV